MAKTVRLKVLDITLKERVGGSLKTFGPGTSNGQVFDHDDPKRAQQLLNIYKGHIEKTRDKTSREAATAKDQAEAKQRDKEAAEDLEAESLADVEKDRDKAKTAQGEAEVKAETAVAEKEALEESETLRLNSAQDAFDKAVKVLEGMTRAELETVAKVAGIDEKQVAAATTKEDLVEVLTQAKATELGFEGAE